MTNPPAFPVEDPFRPFLTSFAENLTERVKASPIQVYQRDAEVAQVLQALASPLKGRVVVIGAPRVGKTAVALAVTQAIARGECPQELRGREVWRFTPSGLPGLAQPGQWQGALDHLMTEWARHPEIILLVDEITRAARLPGARDDEGPSVDVATLLANGLKRHHGLCLAEAEENVWRRFSEAYPDYGRLFLSIRVLEMALDAARPVAHRVAEDLGVLHGVAIGEGALDQVLDLSQRYALDRAQPGKAIDLLQDALAVARPPAALTAEDVIRRFGEQSGLPRMLLDDTVPFNEDEVRGFFKQRVLAQEQAVEAIVQVLSLLRARVNNPSRPMGVLLFLGPTGVGKTELARALAEHLYSNRERLVRFNMADYTDPYQATELFGNPHVSDLNQRRGLITNRLAGRAFAVIVLDEFEKAHPWIFFRFLQLFDEGLLINGHDELINLRNSIIIITSNLGARLVEQGRLGFSTGETFETREKRVMAETERYFTPEFMNRIDAVCIFHPLTRSVMADIARREISDLFKREGLLRRACDVDIADDVIEQVVELGYNPHYGARYLKRQIEKTITYPLARELNALPVEQTGGTIRLYLKHGRVFSAYLAPHRDAASLTAERLHVARPGEPTLDDIRAALPILAARLEALEELYGFAAAQAERDAVLAEMADVSFWNDAASALRKLDAYQRASSVVDLLSELRNALDTLTKECAAPTPSLDRALRPYRVINSELPRIEFTSFLSGPYDTNGAYVQISLKSKATGARQWVAMLAKMYLGWAKGRGLSASVLSEDSSPEGRSVAVTLAISGFGVYGLLKSESGAHRLVQTVKVSGQESFQRYTANVLVLPELSDDELPAASADLKMSTKTINRAGALINRLTGQATAQTPNGQWVTLIGNLPADDLVAEATRLLRTRIFLETEITDLPPAPPGGLVRTYTRSTKDKGIHDHRTGLRSLKVKQTLEGELQMFLDAALEQRRK